MPPSPIITATAEHVKQQFLHESSGHDWWHIYRVWKTAQHLCRLEPSANQEIVELGALLHDIADWKFHGGSDAAGPQAARTWLEQQHVPETTVEQVCHIVANTSFKGAHTATVELTLEGQLVQDADRLDAIGAIGIARAFAYGGHDKRSLYDPEIEPQLHQTAEQYKSNQSPTINHFYEKLLLLKDRMNTQAAKDIAEHRHQVMEQFLAEFYDEWEGRQ
jgi:uncharacterized protein